MRKRNFTGAFIGIVAAMSAVSAFIRVPTQPVPFTMQDFVVFLTPIVFGPRVAFLGFGLYMLLGLIGLPIFASGGGIGYVLMPTFGYLVGFWFSTLLVGAICDNIEGFKRYIVAGFAFLTANYTLGVSWLYFNINYVQNKEISVSAAIAVGMLPYIIPDILKIGGAVSVSPALRKIFANLRPGENGAGTIKI